MLNISKKTDYGLELMISLARGYPNEPIPLSVIAEKKQISLKFLEQVVAGLRLQGLILAKEGKGGGYFLKKDPKKITLGEIIKALEGKRAGECQSCGRAKICAPKAVWRKMEKELTRKLARKKLYEFI